jgi:hypothetical protein
MYIHCPNRSRKCQLPATFVSARAEPHFSEEKTPGICGSKQGSRNAGDQQRREEDTTQIPDQPSPVFYSPTKADSRHRPIIIIIAQPSGRVIHAGLAWNLPKSSEHTPANSFVHTSTKRLLLDPDHGSIVGQHPRTPTCRDVRIRCCAKDRASYARDGRQRKAREKNFHREP